MRSKAEVVQHFDHFAMGGRWAGLYDHDGDAVTNYSFIVRRRRVCELLAPVLGPGMSVLDVGCGPGVMTRTVLEQSANYDGLDLSASMIDQAIRRHGRMNETGQSVQFRVGDVEAMAYPDTHFDVVMALGVLEYLKTPHKAVGEMLRTTRPGGTLLVSVPIAFCPDDVACKLFSPVVTRSIRAIRKWRRTQMPVDSFSHHRYSPAALDSLFTTQGCEKTGQAYYNLELAVYPLRRLLPDWSLQLKRRAESRPHGMLRMFATAYIGRYVKRQCVE